MDPLTLLWSGVEDYTGLWNAAFEAQASNGPQSIQDARGADGTTR